MTLGNILTKHRPPVEKWKKKNTVYSVPCVDGQMQYIGQTKRKLIDRIKEHKNSCRGDLSHIQPNFSNDNGIPYHTATTGNGFDFDNTSILECEESALRRRILEGIHIMQKSNTCVNLIAGQKVDGCWAPLIHGLKLVSLGLYILQEFYMRTYPYVHG